MGLRDEILEKKDFKMEPVSCPEWTSDKLFVRTFNGRQRAKVEALVKARQDGDGLSDNSDLREMVTCYCLCDDQGMRIFEDEDIEKLSEKSGNVLDRIATAGMKLNLMTEEAIQEEEKN